MNKHTAASCFSTFLLPHLLFVPGFDERQKIAGVCCLAWNISFFPDAKQREDLVESNWKTIIADNDEVAPPEIEEGCKQELRMLMAKKDDLFPWLVTRIRRIDLRKSDRYDILYIETDNGAEEKEIVIFPDPRGLSLILDVLRGIQKNTAEQLALVKKAWQTPAVFDGFAVDEIIQDYSVQLCDLLGYRRTLIVWRESQPTHGVKNVISYWLGVLDEIEANTKAVLSAIEIGKEKASKHYASRPIV
ncbi:MAG: hypothetical protein V4568_15010 [Pseudomonadota bacterium]